MATPPLILLIGGHDPSGGAGLQADLETVAAHGCQAITLVTCLTAQDTRNVHKLYPQPAADFRHQLELLLTDINPDMLKIGLLGDARLANALADYLPQLDLPVVLDPVLAAGGGTELASAALLEVMRDRLLPQTRLLTPNRAEARRLSGSTSAETAAQALLRTGCQQVLLTGADEAQDGQVRNSLFDPDRRVDYTWPRLPYTYHGSGCTLASACACQLALGLPAAEAVREAQQFTWDALRRANRPGNGQHIPNRRMCP
jgi:hydroxymethylpyrimidine/phosphomethylpyrimidine kinase